MSSWPALLVAPLVALAQQSAQYALTTPACLRHDMAPLHAVAGTCFLACLVFTGMAWRGGSGQRRPPAQDQPKAERRHTMRSVALMMGSLSTLVSLALWMPLWVLSPCFA